MDGLLKQELRNTKVAIDHQIEVVRRRAAEMNVPASELQTPDGNYLLIPLLAAKAQILSALANLEKK